MDDRENAADEHSCCAPARQGVVAPRPAARSSRSTDGPRARSARHAIEQSRVPAGTFTLGDANGDANPGDGETPQRTVTLAAFDIDATAVTNDDFSRFVDDTGYRSEAEAFGFSAVFHLSLAAPDEDVVGQPPATPWWLGVRGADWRRPAGRGSDLAGLGDHPVVHVSWNDAVAYCDWAGRALPTEAQWEAASRGGLEGARFPWGDDRTGEDGAHLMNVWQGVFPTTNTLDDGYLTTAPVRSYRPNAYGLWQTVGNVWEWCADWWDRTAQARVMRGGSFLCHDSYCNRYRNAARSSNTPDSSMANSGFRTISRLD